MSHPLTDKLIGFWLLGNNPNPDYIRNSLDGKVTGRYDTTFGNPSNVITPQGRAIQGNSLRGFDVRNADYDFSAEGFTYAASTDLSTISDQAVFMINSVSTLSMWADNNLSQLRIAAQPSISYGTDGELGGHHVHAVTWDYVGATKNHYIGGINTANGSTTTPSGTSATITLFGAHTSKHFYDKSHWVAFWDKPLTKAEAEWLTADKNNIYEILEPRTIYVPVGAGGGVTVSITGVSSTSAVGTLSAIGAATASVTGISSTGGVGNLSVVGAANVAITGVAATGGVGTLSVAAGALVSLTGVNATGQAGDVTVALAGGVTVSITGVEATGGIGALSAIGGAVAAPSGVSATGQVGTLTAVVAQTVTLTGVNAAGEVGAMTIDAGAVVSITGVVSTAAAGTITVPTPSGIVYLDGVITLTPVQDATISITPVLDGNLSIN